MDRTSIGNGAMDLRILGVNTMERGYRGASGPQAKHGRASLRAGTSLSLTLVLGLVMPGCSPQSFSRVRREARSVHHGYADGLGNGSAETHPSVLAKTRAEPPEQEAAIVEHDGEQPLPRDRAMASLATQIADSLPGNDRKRIAVLDFFGIEGETTQLGAFIAEELITRLYATTRLTRVISSPIV